MRRQKSLTRRQVLDICYSARTLSAIHAAFDVRGRWLTEHPDDEEVFDLGEMLSMMQEGLQLASQEPLKDPPAPARAS